MKHLHEYITEQRIDEGFWKKLFQWLFRPFSRKEKSSADFNDISIDDLEEPLDKGSRKVRTAQLKADIRNLDRKFQNGFNEFDFVTIEHKPSLYQDMTWNYKVIDNWYEYLLCTKVTRNDILDAITTDKEDKFQFINAEGKDIKLYMYALVEESNRVLQYKEDTYHPIHLYDVEEYRLNDPEDVKRLKNTVKEHPDWNRVQFGRLVEEKLNAIK